MSDSTPDDDFSVESAWQRLHDLIELSAGFWLGFTFARSPVDVSLLRGRTQALVASQGTSFRHLAIDRPEDHPDVFPFLFDARHTNAGCLWVEMLHDDLRVSDDPLTGLWMTAWADLALRLNERRDALRSNLRGGVMLVAPVATRTLFRDGAPDLWSVRSIMLELGHAPAVKLPPPVTAAPTTSTPPREILKLAREALDRADWTRALQHAEAVRGLLTARLRDHPDGESVGLMLDSLEVLLRAHFAEEHLAEARGASHAWLIERRRVTDPVRLDALRETEARVLLTLAEALERSGDLVAAEAALRAFRAMPEFGELAQFYAHGHEGLNDRIARLNLHGQTWVSRREALAWRTLDVMGRPEPVPLNVSVSSSPRGLPKRRERTTGSEDAVTILHVSDIRFGGNHRFGRLGLGGADEAFDSLLAHLSDDLDELKRSRGLEPDLVALTGDLTNLAKPREFDDVLKFCEALCARTGLARDRLLVIPGNHDINRARCEAYFKTCEGDGEPPIPPYWPKWKPYVDFFNALYQDVERYRFTEIEPWTLYEIPELNVVVAGMNSTMRESHQEADHYGWLGEAQLRWFRRQLERYEGEGWLRVGIVHHNALRRAQEDDENLRDADDLRDVLASSLHLLLHGHTHLGRDETLGTLPVLSTGSAAAGGEQRPEEVPNQYQWLRIFRDRIWRGARQYVPQRKRWIGDTRVSAKGDVWWNERRVSFERAHAVFVPRGSTTKRRKQSREEKFDGALRGRGPQPEPDDLIAQVRELCTLRREMSETVETERVRQGAWGEYVRVTVRSGAMVEIYPLGAIETLSRETLDLWLRDVHDPYCRRHGTQLVSRLIVVGAVSEALRREGHAQGVKIETLSEFQKLFDATKYIADQNARLDRDELYPLTQYIPQRMVLEAGGTITSLDDAAGAIVHMLREPRGRFLLVLGDFGTGKTFLLHRIAWELGRHGGHPLPMLIEMRDLQKARTLDELLAQHFVRHGLVYDPAAFRYLLREGRIALLFDGYDELALRVSYDRATEHFATLREAACGDARLVVTSRSQHFRSREQVDTALMREFRDIPGQRVGTLQYLTDQEILALLTRRYDGDRTRASARMELIRDIKDLLGLSKNPRMLSFIADLDEETLRETRARDGGITSAHLYELIISRWLDHERKRQNPKGAEPGPSVQELEAAVRALACRLWTRFESSVPASTLEEHVTPLLTRMAQRDVAAGTLGSSTLLVRDDAGGFKFIHPSVMEWLVARSAADAMARGETIELLRDREVSDLMADFFWGLTGKDKAHAWADAVLAKDGSSVAQSNARKVLARMNVCSLVRADLRHQDLRGQDLAGQVLQGALLDDANLTGAALVRLDLTNASLVGTRLAYADLTGTDLTQANFTRADLSFARFHRANLSRALFSDARRRGASFLGARGVPPEFVHATEVEHQIPSGWGGSVNTVVCSPDGLLLASGHDDGIVRLWDLERGRLLRVLLGHLGSVWSVAFSPDGQILASGAEDGSVRLWSVDRARELRALHGHSGSVWSVAFSSDGRTLASGADDHTVRLWTISSGSLLHILEGHSGSVRSVSFSPRTSTLASGSSDRTVRLWETKGSKEPRILEGHTGSVCGVAFNLDGRMLASSAEDHTVRLWMGDGRPPRILRGHSGSVRSVAFSPDGRTLASGADDHTVRLWAAKDGKQLRNLEGHLGNVRSVVFSPDGQTIVSGAEDHTVGLWTAGKVRLLRALAGPLGSVRSVAFSPDGQSLASGTSDNTVRLWSVNDGKELRVIQGHSGSVKIVSFSPEGRRLASGAEDFTVRLWSADDGRELHVLRGHSGSVWSVAFSPDGHTLASGSSDSTVRLWSTSDGKELRVLRSYMGSVFSMAFSSDRRTLASGAEDRTTRLWSTDDGRELHVLRGHSGSVWSVAFSPDGHTLASGSSDSTVRLWETDRGKELRVLRGHSGIVWNVTFSPDGCSLASGSSDNTVRLWTTDKGKELRIFRGHWGAVRSVAFSPDGRMLASGADDRTVRLWEVATGRLLATLFATETGAVAYTPDGHYKITGDIAGSFWSVIGLHRYELGELDEFFPDGLFISDGRSLYTLHEK